MLFSYTAYVSGVSVLAPPGDEWCVAAAGGDLGVRGDNAAAPGAGAAGAASAALAAALAVADGLVEMPRSTALAWAVAAGEVDCSLNHGCVKIASILGRSDGMG